MIYLCWAKLDLKNLAGGLNWGKQSSISSGPKKELYSSASEGEEDGNTAYPAGWVPAALGVSGMTINPHVVLHKNLQLAVKKKVHRNELVLQTELCLPCQIHVMEP